MKLKHLILFIPLFLLACSEKRQTKRNFIEIDMVPAIEGEAQKMPLQEWAKSIRFIPLETNEDILIGGINEVFCKDGKLLVRHSERISVFNLNGKYLYDIGSKGPGPAEFITIRTISLHNDLIYVHEFRNIIKVYDWKGNFVEKLLLPANAWGVISIPGKEEMLAYVANCSGEESVRFYLMKGGQVLDTIPNPFIYPKQKNAVEVMFREDFLLSQGSLTAFIELNSDTVYQVTEKLETRPYIVFNMGKYLFTRRERYSVSFNDMIDKKLMKTKYPLRVLGEMGEKVYINKGYGQVKHTIVFDDEYTFCYDKRSMKVNKYFLAYPENELDILEGAAFVPRAIFDDKYLVDWEQPDNDENPVLILVEP